MPARLIPKSGGHPIVVDRPIVLVGRQPDCDAVLPNSTKVSRKHCCLAQVNTNYLIRDLGSMNGIRVNGVRVHETELRTGDEVAIGDLMYTFRNEDAAPREPARNGESNIKATLPVADSADLSMAFPVAIPDSGDPAELSSAVPIPLREPPRPAAPPRAAAPVAEAPSAQAPSAEEPEPTCQEQNQSDLSTARPLPAVEPTARDAAPPARIPVAPTPISLDFPTPVPSRPIETPIAKASPPAPVAQIPVYDLPDKSDPALERPVALRESPAAPVSDASANLSQAKPVPIYELPEKSDPALERPVPLYDPDATPVPGPALDASANLSQAKPVPIYELPEKSDPALDRPVPIHEPSPRPVKAVSPAPLDIESPTPVPQVRDDQPVVNADSLRKSTPPPRQNPTDAELSMAMPVPIWEEVEESAAVPPVVDATPAEVRHGSGNQGGSILASVDFDSGTPGPNFDDEGDQPASVPAPRSMDTPLGRQNPTDAELSMAMPVPIWEELQKSGDLPAAARKASPEASFSTDSSAGPSPAENRPIGKFNPTDAELSMAMPVPIWEELQKSGDLPAAEARSPRSELPPVVTDRTKLPPPPVGPGFNALDDSLVASWNDLSSLPPGAQRAPDRDVSLDFPTPIDESGDFLPSAPVEPPRAETDWSPGNGANVSMEFPVPIDEYDEAPPAPADHGDVSLDFPVAIEEESADDFAPPAFPQGNAQRDALANQHSDVSMEFPMPIDESGDFLPSSPVESPRAETDWSPGNGANVSMEFPVPIDEYDEAPPAAADHGDVSLDFPVAIEEESADDFAPPAFPQGNAQRDALANQHSDMSMEFPMPIDESGDFLPSSPVESPRAETDWSPGNGANVSMEFPVPIDEYDEAPPAPADHGDVSLDFPVAIEEESADDFAPPAFPQGNAQRDALANQHSDVSMEFPMPIDESGDFLPSAPVESPRAETDWSSGNGSNVSMEFPVPIDEFDEERREEDFSTESSSEAVEFDHTASLEFAMAINDSKEDFPPATPTPDEKSVLDDDHTNVANVSMEFPMPIDDEQTRDAPLSMNTLELASGNDIDVSMEFPIPLSEDDDDSSDEYTAPSP